MNDEWQWYHIIISTYGSWLYGDARGFRTRHHREHVEGDYKNPPCPGSYEGQRNSSRAALKQTPVVIPVKFRAVVGFAIREKLEQFGAQVVCLSVSGQHCHVLAKLAFGKARAWIGNAKCHAWFKLREHEWKTKLWGKRGKAVPIRDRQHQLNVYRYILDHRKEGAWVWTMLEQKKLP
jgi:hypothetical protein